MSKVTMVSLSDKIDNLEYKVSEFARQEKLRRRQNECEHDDITLSINRGTGWINSDATCNCCHKILPRDGGAWLGWIARWKINSEFGL